MGSLNTTSVDYRHFSELSHKIKYFHLVSQKIIAKKPLNELLHNIIESCKVLLNAESASLLLYDNKTESLFFHIAVGPSGEKIESKRLSVNCGIAGWVAKNKRPLKIDDCYSDERFNPNVDKYTGYKTENMLCVPMMRGNQLIGVIQTINKISCEEFSDYDLDFFNALASLCAIAIENAKVEENQFNENVDLQSNSINFNNDEEEIETILDLNFKVYPTKNEKAGFFNVVKVNQNNTMVFVCDNLDNEINSKLIEATIYSFLKSYMLINEGDFSLNKFVNSLNQFLVNSNKVHQFSNTWFGLFNKKQRTIESVNTGKNVILLLKRNNIVELTENTTPFGKESVFNFINKSRFEKFDTIIYYSNGINKLELSQKYTIEEENLTEPIVVKKLEPAKSVFMYLDSPSKLEKRSSLRGNY